MHKWFYAGMALVLLWLMYVGFYENHQFDRMKWREKHDGRYEHRVDLVDDLLEHHLKNGMNRRTILELVGDPDSEDTIKRVMDYLILEDYGWDIDPVETQYLQLHFTKSGMLSRAVLYVWEQGEGERKKEIRFK